MSDKLELTKTFWSQQEKYNYYLIALCVASLAYSVNLTKDLKLSYQMIPLGIAIVAWVTSIYCGLALLRKLNSYNHINIKKIEASEKPDYVKLDAAPFNKRLRVMNKSIRIFAKIQSITLYIGMLCFLVWRVLEMM